MCEGDNERKRDRETDTITFDGRQTILENGQQLGYRYRYRYCNLAARC